MSSSMPLLLPAESSARINLLAAPFTGSAPAKRADAASLGQWLERELDQLRADPSLSEGDLLKAARAIYSVAFREAARQVTVHCAERGALLSKIFAVHTELLDGMIAERERLQQAETAARAAQQQAAHAARLQAHVARTLLSAQRAMVADDGIGLVAGAGADEAGGGGGGGRGGGGRGMPSTGALRPMRSALSPVGSPSEGTRPADDQPRLLSRTLQLASGLDTPNAEALLRELLNEEALALPSLGTDERVDYVASLVAALPKAQRARLLAEQALQLPPDEGQQLLLELLRELGATQWASILAEALAEVPVQQLPSVLAPALHVMPQGGWLELLHELPTDEQQHVLEGLLHAQSAEVWLPGIRRRLESLPPSTAALVRGEVETSLATAVELWQAGAESRYGAEQAASELAKRVMAAELRTDEAEARVAELEQKLGMPPSRRTLSRGGSRAGSRAGSRPVSVGGSAAGAGGVGGSRVGSRGASRGGADSGFETLMEATTTGDAAAAGAGGGADAAAAAAAASAAAAAAVPEWESDGAAGLGALPHGVTPIDTHTPKILVWDISAAGIPSSDNEGSKFSDSGSDAYAYFVLAQSGVHAKTRTMRNAKVAYWHGDLLQLPLPRGTGPPISLKVQLFDKDWNDDDDLLGTSREVMLDRPAKSAAQGGTRVSNLKLGSSGAVVNFSYRWIDAESGPVVLA